MSDFEPTPVEWLKAQIRNQQFKLDIQRAKNEKLQDIIKNSEKCTENMAKLITKGKIHEAYNLIIAMNEYLVDECDASNNCDSVTNAHYDILFNTMQQLTSKENQVGVPRTPEMKEFHAKMNTHCQMYAIQNDKHYNEYCDNYNNNKPKIDK